MSSTVFTADGNYSWYSDFGQEAVDDHVHQDDSLDIPPLDMVKTLTPSQNYIFCTNGAGVMQFRVTGDGNVDVGGSLGVLDGQLSCKQLVIQEGALLYDDAAIAFVPTDNVGNDIPNRTYQFGRSTDIGDFSHEGDGLQMWGLFDKNGSDKNCAVQLGMLKRSR